MIGLIDCNNFFVSCERVFRPEVADRPVVVMSNNDGCAVAMSNEAKALGIKRGVPVYQVKELIRRHNVVTFSGNHKLYGDMSSRVMATVASMVPEIEIYSIDEAFLDLSFLSDGELETFGHKLVTRVRRDVGIPTSLGIAPTKTLAKIAAHFAKKHKGYHSVCAIDTDEKRRKALSLTDVGDIWGIGRKSARRLAEMGVVTALQLADMDGESVHKRFNVNAERTWRELNGQPCVDMEDEEPGKKQICCSRSFSKAFDDIEPLREAVSYFCDNVARKLRKQHGCARALGVFIQTNSFRPETPQYYGNDAIHLEEATDDTLTLTGAGLRLLNSIYRKGYTYKRAGVFVSDIVDRDSVQPSLFIEPTDRERRSKLMGIMDQINLRGETLDKLHIATMTPISHRVRQEERSPFYTTRLSDIIIVKTDI